MAGAGWKSPADLTIDEDVFEYLQFVYKEQQGSPLDPTIWNPETFRLRIFNEHETSPDIDRTRDILTKFKRDFYKNDDLIINTNDRRRAQEAIQKHRDKSTSLYPIEVVFRELQEDNSQLRVVIMACSYESVTAYKHIIEVAINRIHVAKTNRKTRIFKQETVSPMSLPTKPVSTHRQGFLTYEGMNVYISECNIETWSSDPEGVCIVNPTNDNYVLTSRVSQALKKTAGPNLETELQTLKSQSRKCVCECAVTSAGDLNVAKVIHLVCPSHRFSPNVKFDKKKCKRNIFNSVVNCMKEANKAKMETIVFPFIYTGKLDCSVKMCCLSYAYAVLEYSRTEKVENTGLNNVHFVSNNTNDVREAMCVFKKTLPQNFGQLLRIIEKAPPYSYILVESNLQQGVCDNKVTMNQIDEDADDREDALLIQTNNNVDYVNIRSDEFESTERLDERVDATTIDSVSGDNKAYASINYGDKVPSQCEDRRPQISDSLTLNSDTAGDADNKGYASINYGDEVPGQCEDRRPQISDSPILNSDTAGDADNKGYASINYGGEVPGQCEDKKTQHNDSLSFNSDTADCEDKKTQNNDNLSFNSDTACDVREQQSENLKQESLDKRHADIDDYESIDIEQLNVHDKEVDTQECIVDSIRTLKSTEPVKPLSRKCAESTYLQKVIQDFGGRIAVCFENTDIRKSRFVAIVCPMRDKGSDEEANGNDRIAASVKAAYHQTFSDQKQEDKFQNLFSQFKKRKKYATYTKCADDEEKPERAKYIFQLIVPTVTNTEEVQNFKDGVDHAFDGLMKTIRKVNKTNDDIREVAIPLFGLNDTNELCLVEAVCETIARCLHRCVSSQDDDFKINKVWIVNSCPKIINIFEVAFETVNREFL